jgi:hypothetical protein
MHRQLAVSFVTADQMEYSVAQVIPNSTNRSGGRGFAATM